MKLSTIFLSLLVVFIWGVNPAISKLGLQELPPFTFLTIRYAIVALIFLPFAKPTKKELWQLLFIAISSNVITNMLGYIAYKELSPSASSLLIQTEGPISVLMACIWAKERINLKQVLAILLSFIGVIIIMDMPEMSFYGVALILLSRVFWGACQIVFKNTKHMDTSSFLAYSYLFAVPFTAIGAVWIEDFDYTSLSKVNWVVAGWVLAFEVILLSIAMVLWQKLIAVNGVSKIAPFSTLRIVFGIASGVLMFNDPLNWQILLGSALVTLGVVLTMKEFSIILKARTKSVLVYRNAHRIFMERRLKRISLRKRHR